MDKFKVAVKCDFGTFTTEVEAADLEAAKEIAKTQFLSKFSNSEVQDISQVREGF